MMGQDQGDAPDQQGRLDRVITQYVRDLEAGSARSRQELIAGHPDLADDLRAVFSALDEGKTPLVALGQLSPPPVASEVETSRVGSQTEDGRQNADAATIEAGDSDAPTVVRRPIGAAAKIPARRFGDYELLEEIARGGMGVVHKARQVSLNRTVALKMIRAGNLADPEHVDRFYAEAEAAASLDHPGIVPVYEVGEIDGQHYYSMAFVEGTNLHAKVKDRGPLPPTEAATLMQDVAEAVHYAHTKGILHRDIKPRNVLLDAAGQPRVADFGLAKNIHGDSDLTATGQVVGTPSYMPPEQASGQTDRIGPTSDVYSLGATLYFLLTGRAPFQAASSVETMRQVIDTEPVAPRRLNPAVPHDLETICLKCLAKEPDRRYASAADLSDDLARYANQEPILARPVSSLTRLRLWCRRNPWLAMASSLSVIALTAVAVLSVVYAVAQSQAAAELHVAFTGAQREAVLSTWDRGRNLCEKGDVGHGLLVMAGALESVPEGPEDAGLRKALRTELAGWHRRCHTLRQVWQHPDEVLSVAISGDGKTVATGCADGKVRLWDMESGRCRKELLGHQGAVSAVAFAARGDTFITGGADSRVVLWNASTGQQIGELAGHTRRVYAVAISPDGNLALTGGADRTARLWDLSTRTCRTVLRHPGVVRTTGFSPDGQRFFSGGANRKTGHGELRLYETRLAHGKRPAYQALVSGNKRRRTYLSAAFSPADNDATLVVGDSDWTALYWDFDSGEQFATTSYVDGIIRGVAISPDGKTAVLGGEDSNRALLWDVAELRTHWEEQKKTGGVVSKSPGSPEPLGPPLLHPAAVTTVAFAPDGQELLTACADGYVRVWRQAPGPKITPLPHHPRDLGREYRRREYVVRAVALHPSANLAATAGEDGAVLLWDVPNGVRDGGPLLHSSPLRMVVFTPDGRFVVTGAEDGRVRFWDLQTREVVREIAPPTKEVTWLSISDDGELILVGGAGAAWLWNVKTDQWMGSFAHPGARSVVTAISANNQRFLTAANNGMARLWNQDRKCIQELRHPNRVWEGNFSRDNKSVITTSNDGHARVWDVATGDLLATLRHHSIAFSAVFIRDDTATVTGSTEGGQVWDIPLQRRIGPNCRHQSDVLHVVCSRDGKTAVLADWNGYGIFWSLPQPIGGDPEQVTRWVQTEVGMQLDAGGGPQVLSGTGWQQLRERLRQSPSP